MVNPDEARDEHPPTMEEAEAQAAALSLMQSSTIQARWAMAGIGVPSAEQLRTAARYWAKSSKAQLETEERDRLRQLKKKKSGLEAVSMGVSLEGKIGKAAKLQSKYAVPRLSLDKIGLVLGEGAVQDVRHLEQESARLRHELGDSAGQSSQPHA